jgi:HEAT repeat protein
MTKGNIMLRSRPARIVSFAALVLACFFLAYFALSLWTPQPRFQDHSANYWLRQIAGSQFASPGMFIGPAVIFPGNISVPYNGPGVYRNPSASLAREAFRQLGTNAEPVLIDAIKARENSLARIYRRAYPRLRPALRQRLPEPYDPLALRAAALMALENPVRIHIVPKLLPLLKEHDSGLRLAVLSVIVQPDASQIPFLLLAGDDPDAKVRREVLRCLSQIGLSASNAAPAVLKLCADSASAIRQDAAWTLWKITQQTNAAVPMLESDLRLPAAIDQSAAYHLLLMGDSSPFLVDTLIDALTNRKAGDRAIICSFLRDLGPPAAAAIPALRKAMHDPEPEVRRRAEVALTRIDPQQIATNSP